MIDPQPRNPELRSEGYHGPACGLGLIDTTVQGRSHGGLRLAPTVSPLELHRLARRMTLKFGFLGLPSGGAKAGVRGDPDAPAEQRWARLQQFAAALLPLLRSRVYQPWPDLGTSEAEINQLLATSGMPRHRHDPSRTDSGQYTSLTVIAAVHVAAQHLHQRLGDMTAAVQGFGKVGSTVAQGLAEHDVRVVAISTSQGALYQPHGLPIAVLAELARQHTPHEKKQPESSYSLGKKRAVLRTSPQPLPEPRAECAQPRQDKQ